MRQTVTPPSRLDRARPILTLGVAALSGVMLMSQLAVQAEDAPLLSPAALTQSQGALPPEGVHVAQAPPMHAPEVKEGIQQLKAFSMAFSAVSDAVRPSVVSIAVERAGSGPAQLFGLPPGWFEDAPGQGNQPPSQSGGSGIVVSSDGMILTNNHVVEGADKITVHFATGEEYQATIRGTDPKTDLAIIEVAASDLPYATFGDSDALRVGEWVIAIGHPYSLEYTVTAGIVSAKGRSNLRAGVTYQDFIQTDASINPGNSGGPLVNLDGQVIGINTLIDGRGAGLGFSIPSNMAVKVAGELIKSGKVTRPWLGVRIQDVDPAMAQAMGFGGKGGAFVAKVEPGSPASKAGIRAEDIIVNLNGIEVESSNDLVKAVLEQGLNEKVDVELFREGRTKHLKVITSALPEEGGPIAKAEAEEAPGKLGLNLQAVDDDIAARLGMDEPAGVLVAGVNVGGLAARAGVSRGDVILELNQEEVKSPKELRSALKEHGDAAVLLKIWRNGEIRYIGIEIEN